MNLSYIQGKPEKRVSRQMQTCLQSDMTERNGFLQNQQARAATTALVRVGIACVYCRLR